MVSIIKCNGKVYSGMRFNPVIKRSEIVLLDHKDDDNVRPSLFLEEASALQMISRLKKFFPNFEFQIGNASELMPYSYNFSEFSDIASTSNTYEDSVSEDDIIEVVEYGTEQN